ncbi:MAG TPA: RNA polymerase sigma factor [Lysobacter sp.]
MASTITLTAIDYGALDDSALAALVQCGDRDAFRQITQRCNRRMFRMARGLTGNDAEAEDVVQEAYLHAFEHIATFRGESSLMTWLTRIVLNGAHSRLRQRRVTVELDQVEALQNTGDRVVQFPSRFGSEDPVAAAARDQVRRLLERAVDDLPESFRLVFVLRDVEGCSVEETATVLSLRTETVKTRLHRARRLLRTALNDTVSATVSETFPFLGSRCERMTANVMARIQSIREHTHASTPQQQPPLPPTPPTPPTD